MKKYILIALALLTAPLPSYASEQSTDTQATQENKISPEEAVKNVEAFYMALQNHMNDSQYDKALSMIDKHFAEDFLHYDDGEVSYGKDGMIMFVENNKNLKVRTKMDINIIDTDYMPEKQEVLTKFNISQKFYKFDKDGNEYEDKDSRISLMCSDSLRVKTPEEFQLYKCDCIRKSPSVNTAKETNDHSDASSPKTEAEAE